MGSPLSASIALCTYNGESFLQEQLDSLVRQERLPDEMVVCDDGSTDGTWEVLENFAKTAPFPVRLYQNEKNLGLNRNFEQCALKCSKDVVFFCDQDDVWHPEKIRLHMEVFEHHPEIGLVFSDSIQEELRTSIKLEKCFHLPSAWLKWIGEGRFERVAGRFLSWGGHNLSYRKEFEKLIYPIPSERIFYDRWIFCGLNILTQACFIDQILVNWRKNSCSVTYDGKDFQTDKVISEVYREDGEDSLSMAERLSQLPGRKNEWAIKRLYGRARHCFRRAEMRESFLKRYRYALGELLNGGYLHHSRGFLSFFRDCLTR